MLETSKILMLTWLIRNFTIFENHNTLQKMVCMKEPLQIFNKVDARMFNVKSISLYKSLIIFLILQHQ